MEWIKCSEQMPNPGVPVIAYYVNECDKERRIRAQWIPDKFLSTEEMSVDEGVEYDEETDQCYWPAFRPPLDPLVGHDNPCVKCDAPHTNTLERIFRCWACVVVDGAMPTKWREVQS